MSNIGTTSSAGNVLLAAGSSIPGGANAATTNAGGGGAQQQQQSPAWLFLQYNKHLNVIGEEVRNAFQSDSCADARIVCDGGAIAVHRLVLASASPWLKNVSEHSRLLELSPFNSFFWPHLHTNLLVRWYRSSKTWTFTLRTASTPCSSRTSSTRTCSC